MSSRRSLSVLQSSRSFCTGKTFANDGIFILFSSVYAGISIPSVSIWFGYVYRPSYAPYVLSVGENSFGILQLDLVFLRSFAAFYFFSATSGLTLKPANHTMKMAKITQLGRIKNYMMTVILSGVVHISYVSNMPMTKIEETRSSK